MGLTEITDSAQFADLAAANKIVVIDFNASWCMPCKLAAPEFASLAVKYPGAAFAKADVSHADLMAQFKVNGIPLFVVTKGGLEVDRTVGYLESEGFEKLEQQIRKHL